MMISFKVRFFLKNVSYTLIANLVSILVSLLVTLVLPKFFGVTDYGYWQLYLFYTVYIGFFHFGLNDGIYLRYGGKQYNELDKGLLHSVLVVFSVSQVVISFFLICLCKILLIDDEKRLIIFYIAICLVLTNIRYLFIYLLQATYKIREFAIITISDKLIFIIGVMSLIFVNEFHYRYIIYADLLGRLISLILAFYFCFDIIVSQGFAFLSALKEIWINIKVGSKLMFANIASNCIIGIVRLGIEQYWNIEIFGKVSLMLSISNFFIIFINAVGIILYPILKRMPMNNNIKLYKDFNIIISPVMIGMLLFYYPLSSFIKIWLPQYSDSLKYIIILFPLCVYEGKMGLLYLTYLKVLRKEMEIFLINLFVVGMSIVLTFISTVIYKNLDLAVFSILILVMFRCFACEIFLARITKVDFMKKITWEISFTFLFIILNLRLKQTIAIAICIGLYILYIYYLRKKMFASINKIKQIIEE